MLLIPTGPTFIPFLKSQIFAVELIFHIRFKHNSTILLLRVHCCRSFNPHILDPSFRQRRSFSYVVVVITANQNINLHTLVRQTRMYAAEHQNTSTFHNFFRVFPINTSPLLSTGRTSRSPPRVGGDYGQKLWFTIPPALDIMHSISLINPGQVTIKKI